MSEVTDPAAPSPQADPVKAAAAKAAPVVPDVTGKLLLTPEELDAKVQAALEAAQRKADEKAERERKKAEEEEAKKRGEFEKVAQAAQAERDAARAEALKLRQSIALRDHLAEKHPEYVGCAKYIAPLIPGDAEGDELTKSVEKASADYVKDNPRQQEKATSAAPPRPALSRGGAFIEPPAIPQNNERPARRFSTLTRRV